MLNKISISESQCRCYRDWGKRFICFATIALLGIVNSNAEEKVAQKSGLLKKGDRIVFLGDSNTYATTYIALLDCYFRAHQPELELELLNLGLPSETCSGLSEPDHPFPRPDVHERLKRVLDITKPDVVFVCYGMNDGIYHPFSEQRFGAYQKGIQKLIKELKSIDARIVLMTPPPFDPLPMKKSGKLLKIDSKKNFAWFAIYEDYDDVLAKYSQWVMTQADQVDLAIDLHTPFSETVAEKRKSEPNYTMSGDGVHFNSDGHKIIASEILTALGHKVDFEINQKRLSLVQSRQVLLRDAWITHCGHKRPKTKKGKPLKEALEEARDMDEQIKGLIE